MTTIHDIRLKSGLSLPNLSTLTGVPFYTLRNQLGGNQTPPQYVLDLLDFYLSNLIDNDILYTALAKKKVKEYDDNESLQTAIFTLPTIASPNKEQTAKALLYSLHEKLITIDAESKTISYSVGGRIHTVSY